MDFREFMAEQRSVNKWFVLKIAMYGAFSGALLAVAFVTLALGWP